jgi:hypothetical protein
MSTLKIRLDVKDLYQGPKEFGVVANIHPLPSKERTSPISREKRKKLQNILIPAGNIWDTDPEFQSVTLPPGHYFVEAILPSEEVVGEEVLVADSPVAQELRLVAKESAHEWLSLQRFSGNVVPVEQYMPRLEIATRSMISAPDTILVATVTPFMDEPSAFGHDKKTAWLAQGFFFANAQLKESVQSSQISAFPGWLQLDPPARISASLQANSGDQLYEVFSFDQNNLTNLTGNAVFGKNYRQDRFDRYFLFTHGQDFPDQFSVLPVPWGLVDLSGEASVEALVLQAGTTEGGVDGLDQGFRLSIVVQEKLFGSLIGYLGAGRLPAADTIARSALGMLYEKIQNPLAAAAGAYVLLGNPESDRPEYWHDWVRNLMKYFPWLPDGAILYGKVLLGHSRDQNNLKQARDCFLEGFRRGLPFFSKGVGFLLDGLSRVDNDARRKAEPDEPVEAALKVVRDLALRTNVRQPFTSVLLE